MNDINYQYDLGILTLCDSNALVDEQIEEQIVQKTQQNFQKLYNQLMTIKQNKDIQRDNINDEDQIYNFEKSANEIILPEMITVFPRHKPIPKNAKELTRWQTFAKEKGIEKKKRSRLVYDELTGNYLPRYGSKSVKKNAENAEYIMEVKQGDDPYQDPFKKRSLEKQLSQAKQKLYTENNEKVAKGFIDFQFKGIDLGKKRLQKQDKKQNQDKNQFKYRSKDKLITDKANVAKKLSVAQMATQSQGRFDKKNRNEGVIKQKIRKSIPSFKSNKDENSRNLSILDSIQKK